MKDSPLSLSYSYGTHLLRPTDAEPRDLPHSGSTWCAQQIYCSCIMKYVYIIIAMQNYKKNSAQAKLHIYLLRYVSIIDCFFPKINTGTLYNKVCLFCVMKINRHTYCQNIRKPMTATLPLSPDFSSSCSTHATPKEEVLNFLRRFAREYRPKE